MKTKLPILLLSLATSILVGCAHEKKLTAENPAQPALEAKVEPKPDSNVDNPAEPAKEPAPVAKLEPTEAKPVEAPKEVKPAEAPKETKPAETPNEAKPAEAPKEVKPADVPKEVKPAEVPNEAKPAEAPKDQVPAPKVDTNTVNVAEPPKTNAAAFLPPTPTVVRAAEPAKQEGAAQAPKGDEPVPLIVLDEVPLTDAIRNLARQSNLNFQFDPRITATNQPTVSIRFENVTSQEALSAVLENYGLVLVKDPKTKISRVTLKDPKAEEPLFTKVIQLKYSDPTNMVTVVKPTLSARSQVLADPRTRQLIVTTTERELDGLMALINKLDSATKQVLIEANILETARNPSSIKGIDWSGTFENQNFTFGNNALQGIPPTPAFTYSDPVTGAPITIPGTPGTIGGILGVPRLLANTARGFSPNTAFLNADGVAAVLSFLNKDTDTDVIATPRAVTLDNQMAQLSVTRAFPIFSITPGSANSPAGASIMYTNLGTILQVTPRIAADNNISLKVVPEVSNIDGKDQQTLNGAVNIANIYAVRRIETTVMIPSGHTLVMGGLITDSKTKAYVKIPILGDAPILGAAFRHQKKAQQKQNLMIFLTPTIVEDGDFHIASTGSEFLKNEVVTPPDVKESAWDSAKPHDWTK